MKNCDEMVNSLLERRKRYAAEQKRKKMVITRIVTSMCCVCLIALLGLGVWHSGMFGTALPVQTVDDALYPGIKDNFDESKGESPDHPASNNKIVIHEIADIPNGKNHICLLVDDFVSMDETALKEYYGVNIFPTVPEDLTEWEEQKEYFGIYRRNGGTGEVYCDTQILNYSNKDLSRTVNIEGVKDGLSLCDCIFEATEEKSVINNLEVAIGHSATGHYYAQFMNQNVVFKIVAGGLEQDEFVSVISSLIK